MYQKSYDGGKHWYDIKMIELENAVELFYLNGRRIPFKTVIKDLARSVPVEIRGILYRRKADLKGDLYIIPKVRSDQCMRCDHRLKETAVLESKSGQVEVLLCRRKSCQHAQETKVDTCGEINNELAYLRIMKKVGEDVNGK